MDHLHAETGDKRATFLVKFVGYLVQFMIGSIAIYGHIAVADHQRETIPGMSPYRRWPSDDDTRALLTDYRRCQALPQRAIYP